MSVVDQNIKSKGMYVSMWYGCVGGVQEIERVTGRRSKEEKGEEKGE